MRRRFTVLLLCGRRGRGDFIFELIAPLHSYSSDVLLRCVCDWVLKKRTRQQIRMDVITTQHTSSYNLELRGSSLMADPPDPLNLSRELIHCMLSIELRLGDVSQMSMLLCRAAHMQYRTRARWMCSSWILEAKRTDERPLEVSRERWDNSQVLTWPIEPIHSIQLHEWVNTALLVFEWIRHSLVRSCLCTPVLSKLSFMPIKLRHS